MQFNSSTVVRLNVDSYGSTIHTVLGFSVIAVEVGGDVALDVG